jgi:hypothetical protein
MEAYLLPNQKAGTELSQGHWWIAGSLGSDYRSTFIRIKDTTLNLEYLEKLLIF